MNNQAKSAVLIAAVCLLNSVALGQQKSIRKTRKSTESQKTVCSVAAVPKGMVIVAYKDNADCTSGRELLVKRPNASETVCANSPMPDGYTVQSISGSIECREASSNPLTNALVITRAGDGLSASSTASLSRDTSTDDEEPSTSTSRDVYGGSNIRRQRREGSESTIDRDSDLEPASRIPSREDIEIAVRRSTVIIGMTMQDVSRAWGKSHTTGSLVEKDGLTHIWGYRRGEVSFRNGVAYKILLLKG
ncbi:MAG TPA: hypothetical protein VKB05_02165 [Pyrinomonadaceae bacterium]|nr:hypothetical protein [Pyrinomonadaceae bacterium]